MRYWSVCNVESVRLLNCPSGFIYIYVQMPEHKTTTVHALHRKALRLADLSHVIMKLGRHNLMHMHW